MAMRITDECINCGRCVPVCPGHGIAKGSDDVFAIDPARCIECVGFHAEQQCLRVCPIECCVPDQAHVETETELIEKARHLYPGWIDVLVLNPKTSHFRAKGVSERLRDVGRRVGAQLFGVEEQD